MDEEARLSARGRRGGWFTFPFIIGTMACLTLAAGGWVSNLIVYLIEVFNMKSITAAKIYNFVNGSITMFPIVGAIIADSFVGCFSVIWFSSLISLLVVSALRLLGTFLLLLTASINNLRPPKCQDSSNPCKYPSQLQLAVLYLALALASLGNSGTRFTIATMGADQFDEPKNQNIFFNWYIFTMYTATVMSSTAIVYMEDNVSWALSFSLCAAANVLGLAVFLFGSQFYRLVKPNGSPFKSLACVIFASIGKRNMSLSDKSEDYYHDVDENEKKTAVRNPTGFFRFLNRAALRTETNTTRDGSITRNPWKQCTLQQVEDLKTLIKIFPLWSTGLFLCTPLAIQLSLTIIQALSMDRHLGSRFKIPAGSMPVFILISTSICIFVIDRLSWEKFSRKPLTLLQRVGFGHALTIISMAVSGIVESKRLSKAKYYKNHHDETYGVVPMSAFWLVPQLAIAGMGEAFHFPGQVAFYYQEFPESLKSTSTAAVAMFIGIAFYISNALIDLVRRVTGWLPDDINNGRLDKVYWICCILGGLNFLYYIVSASLYKYQNVEKSADGYDKS